MRRAHAPKLGCDPEQYEDAYWVASNAGTPVGPWRLAVADGATESAFSGLWARQLVDAYGRDKLNGEAPLCELMRLSRHWKHEVMFRDLPWNLEMKVAEGAHATFVGLELREGPHGREYGSWRAAGLGDSCLFQVSGDRLVRALPLCSSSQFGSRPQLVPTLPERMRAVIRRHWWYRGGFVRRGDSLLLMTDAIACWLLQRAESGDRPWAVLARVLGDGQSAALLDWLADLRNDGDMRNDDVTVVWADIL